MITWTVGLFCFLISLVYCVLLLRWIHVWNKKKLRTSDIDKRIPVTRVSIIIAARNEEEQLEKLFDSLQDIDYSESLLEIWISDDHSTDNTVALARKIADSFRFKVNVLVGEPLDKQGKKAALERAVYLSNGELIITTDADCFVKPDWVKSIALQYMDSKPQMIAGMVRLAPYTGVLKKIQALEFLSLTGAGAVAMMLKKPMMCNGANLAFTREAFFKAGGYGYGENSASGDDTFLMLKLHSMNPGSVIFLKDPSATVSTAPLSTVAELFMQRIRWISKAKLYQENYIRNRWISLATAHLIPVLTVTMFFLDQFSPGFTLAVLLLKFIPEWWFIRNITDFCGDRNLLFLFLPLIIFYPVYILVGLVASIIPLNYKWKGRRFKSWV